MASGDGPSGARGRPSGLTGRKAPAGTATLDVCEQTGRARLSVLG
jgi:integrase/recombinase XerD